MKKISLIVTVFMSLSVSAQFTLGGKNNHIFINPDGVRNSRSLFRIHIIPTDKGPALSVSAGNNKISFRKLIPLSDTKKNDSIQLANRKKSNYEY